MTTAFHRGRRLRWTPELRTLVRETPPLLVEDLIMPYFVVETEDASFRKEVASMPGQYQLSLAELEKQVEKAVDAGLMSVLLFGIPAEKDEKASSAYAEDGIVQQAVRRLKERWPKLIVITDVCLCEYMSHGHCGVLCDHGVDNDSTLLNLGKQAVVAAAAGADFIAPSAAMDGQVQAIRQALDAAGFTDTAIMSYSTKFASSFYGPFREAAGTALKGDRKTYQMNPLNRREAIRESLLDEAQGADCLMVKPAGAYLDILRDIRERTELPLGAYQVSGEYAMIKFAALAGAIDEEKVVLESLGAIKRAGADLIFSYFALDLAEKKILR